jgi:hypothetical protein
VEMTSYRLSPVQEPLARDLADRFERCSGSLVVVDPGYLSAPSWCVSIAAYINDLDPPMTAPSVRPVTIPKIAPQAT